MPRWSILLLTGSALVAVLAAVLLSSKGAPAPARAAAEGDELVAVPASIPAPAAPPAAPVAAAPDREAKRLARYDRNDDGAVSREEFLASRRKAFAKLDVNGDGRLTFDEFAVRTASKFDKADDDDNGRLTAAEFATTATRRKAKAACPDPAPSADEA